MNIDDYRAMVAEEKAQKDSPKEEQPTDAQTEPSKTEPVLQSGEQEKPNEPTSAETRTEDDVPVVPEEVKSDAPTTVTIEGLGEVPLEELQKGYLRQSDYTRKTQELAEERKKSKQAVEVYDQLKQDPEKAKKISEQYGIENLDPVQSRIQELESSYHDLLLEREVEKMQAQYEDFDVKEVLKVAYDKKINNLEDAYHLVKASKPQPKQEPPQQVDIESIKEQLRQELRQELQLNQDTTSIIQPGGSAPKIVDEPKLSAKEIKVASMMKMSPTDYAKWREKK